MCMCLCACVCILRSRLSTGPEIKLISGPAAVRCLLLTLGTLTSILENVRRQNGAAGPFCSFFSFQQSERAQSLVWKTTYRLI